MGKFTGQSTHPSLLKDLAEGQSESRSWSIFVEKYHPILRRWCLHWGVRPDDTEDVIQECLIVVFRKLHTYRDAPRSNFRSWLKTVAYHIWIQQPEIIESRKRNPSASLTMPDDWNQFRDQPAREDLEARFEAIAAQEILKMAFDLVRNQVDPTTWKSFELLEIDGLSGKEAAARLEIGIGSVFTNASRVRKRLKREVKRIESE